MAFLLLYGLMNHIMEGILTCHTFSLEAANLRAAGE